MKEKRRFVYIEEDLLEGLFLLVGGLGNKGGGRMVINLFFYFSPYNTSSSSCLFWCF